MHKLTEVQRRVLGHMAEGFVLYSDQLGTNWLQGLPHNKNKVHTRTLSSLVKKGLIVLGERRKYYRLDYVITQAGKEALKK